MNDNLLHDHSAEMCVLGSVIISEPKTGRLVVGFPLLVGEACDRRELGRGETAL